MSFHQKVQASKRRCRGCRGFRKILVVATPPIAKGLVFPITHLQAPTPLSLSTPLFFFFLQLYKYLHTLPDPLPTDDLVDKKEERRKHPVERRFIVISTVIKSDGFRGADAERGRLLARLLVADFDFLRLPKEDRLLPNNPGVRYRQMFMLDDGKYECVVLLHTLPVSALKPYCWALFV